MRWGGGCICVWGSGYAYTVYFTLQADPGFDISNSFGHPVATVCVYEDMSARRHGRQGTTTTTGHHSNTAQPATNAFQRLPFSPVVRRV
jgi:hypothetical protein